MTNKKVFTIGYMRCGGKMETVDTPPLTEKEWERVKTRFLVEWRKSRRKQPPPITYNKCIFDE